MNISLFSFIYHKLQLAIKKDPTNTHLRLDYIFFLMEKLNQKVNALQQLYEIEKNHSSFDL